jgi:hypothetical protein
MFAFQVHTILATVRPNLITFPSYLNSHTFAWQQTRGLRGFPPDSPPSDHLFWATTAMKNATSWIHIDANGFGTVIDSVTGTKYWVVCRRRRDLTGPGTQGDLSSMFCFEGTQVDEAATSCFEHEAVVIQPGSVL